MLVMEKVLNKLVSSLEFLLVKRSLLFVVRDDPALFVVAIFITPNWRARRDNLYVNDMAMTSY